ncbi:hypothetical protein NXS19_013362 [Fusarium pseudograminearum]|nr:hypothetical protein NXS19_013362 [Fusarium pseudograminearum]
MIAAAGVGLERPDMQSVATRIDGDAGYPSRPPTSLSGNAATMERPTAADAPYGQTQRKLERIHSKSRRDHTPITLTRLVTTRMNKRRLANMRCMCCSPHLSHRPKKS